MENKQNSKKVWRKNLVRGSLIALCAVMLLCGSYFATLALLNQETGTVTNTFKQVTELADSLLIVEHAPKDTNGDGIWDEEDAYDGETYDAEYLYAPGVTLKKRAYVRIINLHEYAYLYVTADAVGNDFEDEMLAWEIDSANWTSFKDENDKTVYVYKGGLVLERGKSYNPKGNEPGWDIILNDSVTVSHEIYDITNPDYTISTLTFSAYLVQATGFADYEAAWNATYGQ